MLEINTSSGKNEWPGKFFGASGGSFVLDLYDAKAMVIRFRFRLVQFLIAMYLIMEVVFSFLGREIQFQDVGKVRFPFIEFMVCLCGFMAFEILYRRIQNYYLIRREAEPLWIKMMVITVEVSMPVFGILLQALHVSLADCERISFPINHISFIFLSMLYLRFWLCFYAGVVAVLERLALFAFRSWSGDMEFLVGSFWSLWHLFLAAVMLGALAYLMRKMVEMVLKSSAERARVQDIFGRFVSKDVAQKLVEKQASLGGESLQASVMFLDIRNFTRRSSFMTPEEAVEFLNQLFAVTVKEVEKAGGIVNKFLGDGFMAIFGAPLPLSNPSAAAVECAGAIFARLREFNASRGGDPVEVGIGINYGPLVSGVVGTPERKEFTVIGDTVNLASRIEGLNKELGSHLLISLSVHENLNKAHQARFEAVPNVRVKGKIEPFTVYRCIKT